MSILSDETKLAFYGDLIEDNFKNEDIKNMIEAVVKVTPSIFFVSPTSSTGKYHPKEVNGLSGVFKHSVAVLLNAKDLLDNDTLLKFLGIDSLTTLEREVILAASLLHDNAKYGVDEVELSAEKIWTKGDHPILVRKLVENADFDKNEDLVEGVLSLIDTHMGQWNTYKDEELNSKELPKPETPEQLLVHLADYMTSKKSLDVVSEMSLPTLNEKFIRWFQIQND